MSNKVLIITSEFDGAMSCVHSVKNALNNLGAHADVFYTNKFPSDYSLTFNDNDLVSSWSTPDAKYCLADYTAIWLRRWNHVGKNLEGTLDKIYLPAAIQEAKSTFDCLLATFKGFILDDPYTFAPFRNKLFQLQLAKQVGLITPRTCISNNIEELLQFSGYFKDGIIAKPLTTYYISENHEDQATVFANLINPSCAEDLDGLQNSPMIFQEPITKLSELRIVVVGLEVFAFEINSQQHENAQHDWRKEGKKMLDQWQVSQIPEALKQNLLRYMDVIKRNYAAFDFILTTNKEYVFLEANLIGEFFWLDEISGGQISNRLAKVLINKAPRRTSTTTYC